MWVFRLVMSSLFLPFLDLASPGSKRFTSSQTPANIPSHFDSPHDRPPNSPSFRLYMKMTFTTLCLLPPWMTTSLVGEWNCSLGVHTRLMIISHLTHVLDHTSLNHTILMVLFPSWVPRARRISWVKKSCAMALKTLSLGLSELPENSLPLFIPSLIVSLAGI